MSELAVTTKKSESPAIPQSNELFQPAFRFSRPFGPAVDIRHCDGHLVVTAELPGLKKEEFKVELTADTLVIQGERKQKHKEDQERCHQRERNYGQFYRSIALPQGAKTDQIKAELQDGVLKISVPVAQAKKQSWQVPIEGKAAAAKA